jgi:hypothetical protein
LNVDTIPWDRTPNSPEPAPARPRSRFNARRQNDAAEVDLLAALATEDAGGAVDRVLLPAQSQAAASTVFRATEEDSRGPTTRPRQPRGFVFRFRSVDGDILIRFPRAPQVPLGDGERTPDALVATDARLFGDFL